MSKNYVMKAESREASGKGVARTLRRENKVPAVIYGDKKESIKITLPAKETNMEYNKGQMFTTLCDLALGNDTHMVLVRDVQLHPVTDLVEHIDFLRVTPKTTIKVMVPVKFINEEACPAIQEKGVFNVVRHDVELVCQATAIPDHIEIDLTPFNIGDTINISNATVPEGTKPVIDDRDFTLVTISAPRTAEQIAAEDAADAVAGVEDADAEGEEKAEGQAAEGDEAEGEDKK